MGGADCDVFPVEYEEAVEFKYRVRLKFRMVRVRE